MCICSFILQSHLMITLRLSKIISTVEAMEVPTSHLVTAHPLCSATCISMQGVQKIHFHKHLSWEKSSGTSQVYRTFLGSENGHVGSQRAALCEDQFWRTVTWTFYYCVLSFWCQIWQDGDVNSHTAVTSPVVSWLRSWRILVEVYLEDMRIFAKWLRHLRRV